MKLDVRSRARVLQEQGNVDDSWRGSQVYGDLTQRTARLNCTRPAPQHGIALVITLILLAVITFMAVTFLVVSHSQRAAVATETDQAVAKGAAENGMEMAKAQALALIIGFTNANNYSEFV